MRQRGFTAIEILIGAALFSMIAGVLLGLAATGQKVYVTGENNMKASTRVHGLMERILTEVRQGSFKAEDVDEDDDVDELDEDSNGNGAVDDDWSLADSTTSTSLSFNAALGGGVFSEKITFSFDGKRVWRTDGDKSLVLANDVKALTFTRNGNTINVSITLQSGVVKVNQDRGGKRITLKRDVLIRN